MGNCYVVFVYLHWWVEVRKHIYFKRILIIAACFLRINTGYCEAQTLTGHSNFVVCVCVLPPHNGHPLGLILTGSNDHCICVFAPDSSKPLYVLKGHANTGKCDPAQICICFVFR